MKFNANYVTKDGWFEVMLDKSTLIKPQEENYIPYHKSKEITDFKITVYNNQTERMSDKSIYYNEKKGFYFKGSSSYWTKTPHSKYYINELIEVKENEKLDN